MGRKKSKKSRKCTKIVKPTPINVSDSSDSGMSDVGFHEESYQALSVQELDEVEKLVLVQPETSSRVNKAVSVDTTVVTEQPCEKIATSQKQRKVKGQKEDNARETSIGVNRVVLESDITLVADQPSERRAASQNQKRGKSKKEDIAGEIASGLTREVPEPVTIRVTEQTRERSAAYKKQKKGKSKKEDTAGETASGVTRKVPERNTILLTEKSSEGSAVSQKRKKGKNRKEDIAGAKGKLDEDEMRTLDRSIQNIILLERNKPSASKKISAQGVNGAIKAAAATSAEQRVPPIHGPSFLFNINAESMFKDPPPIFDVKHFEAKYKAICTSEFIEAETNFIDVLPGIFVLGLGLTVLEDCRLIIMIHKRRNAIVQSKSRWCVLEKRVFEHLDNLTGEGVLVIFQETLKCSKTNPERITENDVLQAMRRKFNLWLPQHTGNREFTLKESASPFCPERVQNIQQHFSQFK